MFSSTQYNFVEKKLAIAGCSLEQIPSMISKILFECGKVGADPMKITIKGNAVILESVA